MERQYYKMAAGFGIARRRNGGAEGGSPVITFSKLLSNWQMLLTGQLKTVASLRPAVKRLTLDSAPPAYCPRLKLAATLYHSVSMVLFLHPSIPAKK